MVFMRHEVKLDVIDPHVAARTAFTPKKIDHSHNIVLTVKAYVTDLQSRYRDPRFPNFGAPIDNASRNETEDVKVVVETEVEVQQAIIRVFYTYDAGDAEGARRYAKVSTFSLGRPRQQCDIR